MNGVHQLIARYGLVAMLGGCVTPRTNEQVIRATGHGDASIQAACDSTVRTCTRCHDLNRIMATRFGTPASVPVLVARMRYMRSSGITADDADQAVTCLVYRQFGRPGLAAVADREPTPAPAAASVPAPAAHGVQE